MEKDDDNLGSNNPLESNGSDLNNGPNSLSPRPEAIFPTPTQPSTSQGSNPENVATPAFSLFPGVVSLVILGALSAFASANTDKFETNVAEGSFLTHLSMMVSIVFGWMFFLVPVFIISRGVIGGLFTATRFKFEKQDFIKGFGFGLAAVVLAQAMVMLFLSLTGTNPDEVNEPANNLLSGAVGWWWILYALLIGVATPIVEEMFFRGYFLYALREKLGPWVAIILSALIFGFAHGYVIEAAIPVFLLGVLLAWRTAKTGRIGQAVVIHSTFNFATLIAAMIS